MNDFAPLCSLPECRQGCTVLRIEARWVKTAQFAKVGMVNTGAMSIVFAQEHPM